MIYSPSSVNHPLPVLSVSQRRIYQLVRQNEVLSRADIVRQLDLTFPSVSRIVAELLHKNLLLEGGTKQGPMGKPAINLSINPMHNYSLGVHLGRDTANVVVMNAQGQTLKADALSATSLPEKLRSMLERAKIDNSQLLGIGISTDDGALADDSMFPLRTSLDTMVLSEPMIAARVRAERYFGQAQHVESFLYYDAQHQELGAMIGAKVMARPGTLNALLGVTKEEAVQGSKQISTALKGAAALLQTETVFVNGLEADDEYLLEGLSSLKVRPASFFSGQPQLAAATLPLYEAYSVV